LAQHTYSTLMRRLGAAGFKREFARVAVLPEWWDASCEADGRLLGDLELRVARFLGAPLSLVREPRAPLVVPTYEGAQLRRVRDIDRDRLRPAIHAALHIASAALRNCALPPLRLPPSDPLAWRREISRPYPVLRLDEVLADAWGRGMPVLHVDALPTPAFQGLACIVEGRPVVLICHSLDEPARLAFIIAHEIAHVVYSDCSEGQPVVDEEEEISDDADIEKRADAYATALLTGGAPIPDVSASGFKDLAQKAISIEKERGVDASAVVWSWARRTGDYAKATMAAQALYRTRGGKRAIRTSLDKYLDLENASDSDRALLRCLYGDPGRNAAASS
jgi:Zn-dependent peptidase ImmA (M78 family)